MFSSDPLKPPTWNQNPVFSMCMYLQYTCTVYLCVYKYTVNLQRLQHKLIIKLVHRGRDLFICKIRKLSDLTKESV